MAAAMNRAVVPGRMMAVHAHPDDESSKGAATCARYAAAGHRVRVVTCTGGERGDILNPKMAADPRILTTINQVRRNEMALAAEILGVEHEWLGFVDSGLPEGDPLPPLPEGCFALQDVEAAGAVLARSIRAFRPHVLTTYDELGGYPHPDHIMTHKVTMAALKQAAAAGADLGEDAGEPWRVPKVYYNLAFTIDRLLAVDEALRQRGLDSPFADWIADRSDRPQRENKVTARVECAEYFEVRDQALRAHQTQIDPDGFFFAIPREVETQVWPYEEFELVYSDVPVTLPEADLFAGLALRTR